MIRIKNVTAQTIFIDDIGIRLESAYDLELDPELSGFYLNSVDLDTAIKAGDIQVGNADFYYTNAADCEVLFKSTLGFNAFLIATDDTVTEHEHTVVIDPITGVRGSPVTMMLLLLFRAIFNTPESPLYSPYYTPIKGTTGYIDDHESRIAVLEDAVATLQTASADHESRITALEQ